jgi:uncharacterized protein
VRLADVNVLLAAFRRDHVHHQRCRAWLDGEVNGGVRFGVAPQVLSSVLRIATNPRVFMKPSTMSETLNFTDTLLGAPDAVIVSPGPRHWSIFSDLLQSTGAKGDLVADAWFAAIAIEWGCEWVTLDRDYNRFKQLAVSAP